MPVHVPVMGFMCCSSALWVVICCHPEAFVAALFRFYLWTCNMTETHLLIPFVVCSALRPLRYIFRAFCDQTWAIAGSSQSWTCLLISSYLWCTLARSGWFSEFCTMSWNTPPHRMWDSHAQNVCEVAFGLITYACLHSWVVRVEEIWALSFPEGSSHMCSHLGAAPGVWCMFTTSQAFACLMSGSKSYSLTNDFDFRLSR